MNETMWAVVVSHKHGEDVWVHRTEQGARHAIFEYCAEWWKQELDTQVTIDSFDTEQKAVDWYFENVEDEWYFIRQVEIGD